MFCDWCMLMHAQATKTKHRSTSSCSKYIFLQYGRKPERLSFEIGSKVDNDEPEVYDA